MHRKMVLNVLNVLMIDITSTNTKPARHAMSSMMAALNAQLKINASNANRIVSTFRITSVAPAHSSMVSASNAQLRSTALNAYQTSTTSMIHPSPALPANQRWRVVPPARPSRNAQTALRPTSSIANRHAQNASQYWTTASPAPAEMPASPVKTITTLSLTNVKIAITLLPTASPARAIMHAASASSSMYSPKISNASSVTMLCRTASAALL